MQLKSTHFNQELLHTSCWILPSAHKDQAGGSDRTETVTEVLKSHQKALHRSVGCSAPSKGLHQTRLHQEHRSHHVKTCCCRSETQHISYSSKDRTHSTARNCYSEKSQQQYLTSQKSLQKPLLMKPGNKAAVSVISARERTHPKTATAQFSDSNSNCLPFSTAPDKFCICQTTDCSCANLTQTLIHGCSLLHKRLNVHLRGQLSLHPLQELSLPAHRPL